MAPKLPGFAFLALSLAIAAPASAGGVNLSWNDCGTFGAASKTFACDTNVGSRMLVASFVAPQPLDHFVGMAGVIDLCSMTTVLPSWWMMYNAGTCRQNAISTSFDFTGGPFSCTDPWGGQAVGGMDYTIGYSWQFNSARIRTVCAIPSSAIHPIDAETEYYAFRVTIKNDKTVGPDACAGCLEDVCIILNSIELDQQAGYGDFVLTQPLNRMYVEWQGAVFNCPFVVPTRAKTWGQVKAMYR